MVDRGGRKQRPHRPHEMGPRTYREAGSRWWKVDLRPWGGRREVIRNPEAPGWPVRGERTELEDTAERWKWAYLGEIHRGQRRETMGLGPEPKQLGEAVEAFLAHRLATVERATWINARTSTGHLLEHFGKAVRTSSIEAAQMQLLVEDMLARGYDSSTLATYIRAWRLFFEWCWFGVCGLTLRQTVSARKLAAFHDPTDGLRLPERAVEDITPLADAEIPELFKAARKVDAQQIGFFPSAVRACAIGLYMGLRQGEIFALEGQLIDVATKTVRVRFQVQKDRPEFVPTKGKNARTALILQEWWDTYEPKIGLLVGRGGRPVSTRTQRNLITRVLDTAGLNDVGRGWHLLRHTYSRIFLERGGSMGQLQSSLGHSSVRTTEATYAHFTTDVAARLAREKIYGA